MLVTNKNKRELYYKELKATDPEDGTPMGSCMIVPVCTDILLLTDSTLLGWDVLLDIPEEYLRDYKRSIPEKIQEKYPYGWWITPEYYYQESTQVWDLFRAKTKLYATTPETKVIKLGKYRVKTR